MKTKFILIFIISIIFLYGCSNNKNPSFNGNGAEGVPQEIEEGDAEIIWAEDSFKGFSFKYPQNWRIQSSKNSVYLYPTENNEDALIMLSFAEIDLTGIIGSYEKEVFDSFINGLKNSNGVSNFSESEKRINGCYGRQASYDLQSGDTIVNVRSFCWSPTSEGIINVTYRTNTNNPNDYLDICLEVIASIVYQNDVSEIPMPDDVSIVTLFLNMQMISNLSTIYPEIMLLYR